MASPVAAARTLVRLTPLISYDPQAIDDLTSRYPPKRTLPLSPPSRTSEPIELLRPAPPQQEHHTPLGGGPSVKSPSKLARILSPTPRPPPSEIADEPLLLSAISHADQPATTAQNPAPTKYSTLGKRLQALKASTHLMRSRSSSNPVTTATTTTTTTTTTTPTAESLPEPPSPAKKPTPPARLRARRASRPPTDPSPPLPSATTPQPTRRTTPRVETEQVKLAKLTKQQTNINKKRFCVIKVDVVHLDFPRPPSPEGNFRKGAPSSNNKKKNTPQAPPVSPTDRPELSPLPDPPPGADGKKQVRWNDAQLTVDLEELYRRRTLDPAHEEEEEDDDDEEPPPPLEARPEPCSPSASSTTSSSLSSLPSSASPPRSSPAPDPAPAPACPATLKPILKLNFGPASQSPILSAPSTHPSTDAQVGEEKPLDAGDNPPPTARAVVYRLDPLGNLVLPPPTPLVDPDVPPDPLASIEPPFVKVLRRIWRDH
ncbi:hypothetical protein PtA15_11A35 [Puccinia triticina]|uniref:Uncharacterized protein n=1 Tax=Puccinia triticina TaxID=208348 RepID=A0ABY7CVM0_9BASI|nr:uncharacterized protein PtA15_11A35 [Puccinia triticina]WAQ89348.1 hypothetical protein PtA15_11A35 [Puccinia triticina]WAR59397.1 hypothetical protein PtB15_11B37 [Puccinia triticina]